jgi:Fur family ferric uptake transcriptional regulator
VKPLSCELVAKNGRKKHMSHTQTEYETILRSTGHRVTSQRVAILDAVCEGGGHATLGQIYARVRKTEPSIDRSTVYRALRLFADLDLVVSADIGDGETYYEIATPRRHHHLVCRDCGTEQAIDDDVMRGMFDQILKRYGFSADANHLVLGGRCRDCLLNAAQPR